jgi:hypothetical protein
MTSDNSDNQDKKEKKDLEVRKEVKDVMGDVHSIISRFIDRTYVKGHSCRHESRSRLSLRLGGNST